MPKRWISVAALVAAFTTPLVAGGCGSSTETARHTTTVIVKTVEAEPTAAAPKPRRSPFKRCDANIRARRATTTCGFAQNAFYAFWQATDAGDDAVAAYSPATDQHYDLECDAGTTVVCKAGDGYEIRFAMSAVDAYDADQAATFCRTHDTTGAGPGEGCDDEPAPDYAPSASSEQCDPNYEGECLDPKSDDYDCEGGSGDGPDYTGKVAVVGDDVYDLDRDGDGIACDV